MAEEGPGPRREEPEFPPGPPIGEVPPAPEMRPDLPPRESRRRTEDEGLYQRMGLAYTIPAALVAPILVLTLLGAWLDSQLHRSPLFTLGGAILGFVTGMINMIRLANRLNR